MKLFILLFLTAILSSCGFLDNRTFIDEMDKNTDGFWVAGRDFPQMAGDSGQASRTYQEIMERTPASYRENQDRLLGLSIARELAQKEARLSDIEYRKYDTYRDLFENDSEKIFYLDLSESEREIYLRQKGLLSSEELTDQNSLRRETAYQVSDENVLAGNDIAVGMSKHQVIGVWGQPARIDVAGNPRYQNERWAFYESGRVRYIYFENGQVQGWAMD